MTWPRRRVFASKQPGSSLVLIPSADQQQLWNPRAWGFARVFQAGKIYSAGRRFEIRG